MIRFEHVSKRFGAAGEVEAVSDLSLEIPRGDFCCLIGPSGCGKTTTLKMINRMVEPTSGRILVDGRDVTAMPAEELRRSMGYVIQSIGLFPHMSVAENVGVVPRLLKWPQGKIRARTLELLELLRLPPDEFADKYPAELSGGQAQRVGVARALAADPDILLMDEPFGALDPITRDRLQAQFARIQQELKKTIVFVTHDIDEAIRLASRIVIMRAGRLVQYDTPEQLLAKPASGFVKAFIGSDRALKKLARVAVSERMGPADSFTLNDGPAAPGNYFAQHPDKVSVWLVDETGRLLGWLDRGFEAEGETLDEAMVPANGLAFGLTPEASLKEALSTFLRHGVVVLPVLDHGHRLVGEVCLTDLLGA